MQKERMSQLCHNYDSAKESMKYFRKACKMEFMSCVMELEINFIFYFVSLEACYDFLI
jgi:hypothetical protein